MNSSISLRSLLIPTLLLSVNSLAFATDYAGGFSVGVDAKHDDNIRLVDEDREKKTEISGAYISPTLKLDAATENTQISFDSLFGFGRYNNNDFNTDDIDLQLALSHRFERSSIGLSSQVRRDTTVTSELTESGRIGDKAVDHQRYNFSPFWNYKLNETNQLRLQAGFRKDNYESKAYRDYSYTTANIDWIHTFNERIQIVARGLYSDYETEFSDAPVTRIISLPFFGEVFIPSTQEIANNSTDKGIQLGLYYLPSEQTSINLLVGKSRSTSKIDARDPNDICNDPIPSPFTYCIAPPDSTSSLLTTEIEASWEGERNELHASLSKNTQPTSDGYTMDSGQLSTSWVFHFSELYELQTKIKVIRNRNIGSENTQVTNRSERNYGSASIRLQRQLTENWFANAEYRYSRQEYLESDYVADSNLILLGIRYTPAQWHWSR